MFFSIWEYYVKAEQIAEFEEVYSATGAWAKLFQESKGYLGTELLVDEEHSHRYITIDRWISSAAYATFLAEWTREYAELDAKCEGLMEREILVGKWGSIS